MPLTLFLCFALSLTLFGQNYRQQYDRAKALFAEKKYSSAIQAFEPIVAYENNPYFRYASFYYALSMYELGRLAMSKTVLIQLQKIYPDWTQRGELHYWLAKIYFEQRQYFQAMNTLKKCTGKAMQNSMVLIKSHYLSNIRDVETLHMLLEEYPKDRVVARLLVDAILLSEYPMQYKSLSDSLYEYFSLKRADTLFFPKENTLFKDRYTVSLLFPFMVETLYPTPEPKINQNVLDLYKGIAIARDTLEEQQIHIDLKLYDTRRNLNATAEILRSEEIKNSDLLVGPLFSNQIPLVKNFSKKHHINMINPVSGNSLFLKDNPHTLLYMPERKTIGMRSAEWLDAHTTNKNCMIFFDLHSKNKTVVQGFLERAEQLGLQVVAQEPISVQHADRIFQQLTSPHLYDGFKDSLGFATRQTIGSIFVASDDPIIYTRIISGIETRGSSVIIMGNQNWLNNDVVSFETYERLNIIMAAPDFYPLNNSNYRKFEKQYMETYGEPPSQYATIGYDFMLFVGHCFNRYGVFFQKELSRQAFIEGFLSPGYNFRYARSNQFVPFIHFKDGTLTVFH